MKRISAVLAVTVLCGVAAALLASPPAHAADKFSAQLTSNDGGPTNVGVLTTNNTFSVQCAIPSCIRVGNDAGLVDCTKDPQVGGTVTDKSAAATLAPPLVYVFESQNDTKVTALALDAGNPKCNLYLRTLNKPRTVP